MTRIARNPLENTSRVSNKGSGATHLPIRITVVTAIQIVAHLRVPTWQMRGIKDCSESHLIIKCELRVLLKILSTNLSN